MQLSRRELTCFFKQKLWSKALKHVAQQPETKKTHTYGSIDHDSGCAVATIFFGDNAKGYKTHHP